MRRIGLAAALLAAAMVVPAQAAKPADPGSQGTSHGHHGKSCKPHRVGWVVKGTLVEQSLEDVDGDGKYSGTVTVTVTHTNKHARDEKGGPQPKTYTVKDVKVTFGVNDANNDGKQDGLDVAAGDQVKLIGKVTRVRKKCDQSEAGKVSIRKVVFNDAEVPEPTE